MHADLAAQYDAGIGLANEAQSVALRRVFAQAISDRRRTAAERQKPAGRGKLVAIGHGVRDLLGGSIVLLCGGDDAQRDQIAVGRGMGDVAGAQERRLREAPPHTAEVIGSPWNSVGPGSARALGIGWREEHVGPFGVEMHVVPGDIFVRHRAGRRMRGYVLD